MKKTKLQSAMEYLMTYGWSILIIAIVMVALYSLGIFGGSPLGTACIAASGFLCQNPILHQPTFNVLIGQATSTTWTDSNIYWVPQGFLPPTGGGASCTATNTITGGITCFNAPQLYSGQKVQVTLLFTPLGSSDIGKTYAGALWAIYELPNNNWYEIQVATVTLKSV